MTPGMLITCFADGLTNSRFASFLKNYAVSEVSVLLAEATRSMTSDVTEKNGARIWERCLEAMRGMYGRGYRVRSLSQTMVEEVIVFLWRKAAADRIRLLKEPGLPFTVDTALRYVGSFKKHARNAGWSVEKGIAAKLVGLKIASLNAPIINEFPEILGSKAEKAAQPTTIEQAWLMRRAARTPLELCVGALFLVGTYLFLRPAEMMRLEAKWLREPSEAFPAEVGGRKVIWFNVVRWKVIKHGHVTPVCLPELAWEPWSEFVAHLEQGGRKRFKDWFSSLERAEKECGKVVKELAQRARIPRWDKVSLYSARNGGIQSMKHLLSRPVLESMAGLAPSSRILDAHYARPRQVEVASAVAQASEALPIPRVSSSDSRPHRAGIQARRPGSDRIGSVRVAAPVAARPLERKWGW